MLRSQKLYEGKNLSFYEPLMTFNQPLTTANVFQSTTNNR